MTHYSMDPSTWFSAAVAPNGPEQLRLVRARSRRRRHLSAPCVSCPRFCSRKCSSTRVGCHSGVGTFGRTTAQASASASCVGRADIRRTHRRLRVVFDASEEVGVATGARAERWARSYVVRLASDRGRRLLQLGPELEVARGWAAPQCFRLERQVPGMRLPVTSSIEIRTQCCVDRVAHERSGPRRSPSSSSSSVISRAVPLTRTLQPA
jgi:hypothetical protein